MLTIVLQKIFETPFEKRACSRVFQANFSVDSPTPMAYTLDYQYKPCIDEGNLIAMPTKLSFVESKLSFVALKLKNVGLKLKNVCPKSSIGGTSSSFVEPIQ